MQNYQTAQEKAFEWNITPRHVQYLCRMGKVQGAIKRAGSWFIPGDAPVPVKNTKSGAADFKFVGTKSKIFDSAIKLFMLHGFSAVSLRDIARDVGIRQSTIYNHFKSKQEILDIIYDFYCHYYLSERPSLASMQDLLRRESVLGIFKHIHYEFNADSLQKMSDITKIVFQRIAIDERARDIAKSLMIDEGTRYVKDVFGMGIQSGRFASFDARLMAVFINAVRIFTLYNWIVDPSSVKMATLIEDEHALYQYAASFIKDLSAAGQQD